MRSWYKTFIACLAALCLGALPVLANDPVIPGAGEFTALVTTAKGIYIAVATLALGIIGFGWFAYMVRKKRG